MTKSLRTTVYLGVVVLISAVLLPHRTVAGDLEKIAKPLPGMGGQLTPAAFLKAVDESDVKAVKRFLAGGIDVRTHDSSGRTALHLAANNDNAEIISMLLKAGAEINAKDEDGKTPLLAAVTNGYGGAKATAPLVAAGADLKIRYKYGTSILYEAANSDAAVPVQALIKAGAELEAANEKGETPLFLAASLGRKVTPLLIQAGANPNATNNDGQSALMAAAEGGELESVRLLIGAKANVNAADTQGNTPLINAAGMLRSRMTSFKVDEASVTKMVELLLGAGAGVATSQDGTTPLIAAAREGHADAVALLLQAKVAVDAKTTPDGDTALMEAAKAKHADVVKRLLAAGADPKVKDRVGRTAADWGKDDPEVTAALGGTPAAPKAAAVSPEQRERARQKLEALGYREFTEDSFVMSAHQGEIDAARAFLDYGLSIESKDSGDHATTPLLAAATRDDPALGLFLIKAGANVGAKDPNGSTPIILAASQCGQTELVKALIKADADVNAKAAGGASALMMAEVMSCAETLKVLTAAGARK